MENNSRLWNHSFTILNILFFLVFSNISLFYLYPLALRSMGLPDSSIGFVMGIFSVATVLSRPFMGKLIIHKGEHFVISISMIVILLASLCYLIVRDSLISILLVRIVHGIGFSAFISATFSLVAIQLPPNRRGQAYGIVGACVMGAVAVIPPFGEILVQKYGYNYMYVGASLLIVLAWTTSYFMQRPKGSNTSRASAMSVSYLQLLKSKSFTCTLVTTLIFAHCQSTMLNFVALLARYAHTQSGKFFFATFFVAILMLIGIGKTIDRYGKIFFLKISYPFLSAGLLLTPALIKDSLFFIPACLVGLAMGCLFPAHNALAAAHGHDWEKPAVMSIFTAVYDTGFISGAFLSGLVAQLLGIEYLFIVTGLLATAGFIFVLFAPISEHDNSLGALRNTHT